MWYSGDMATRPRAFAVFDLDGTLVRWQLYHAVVDKLAKAGHLGDDAHDRLHEARMKWKRRETGYSFSDYERVLIQTYEDSVTELSADTLSDAVQEVIGEYKDQVYTYTRDLIAELKAKGYTLLAISGSHEELVSKIAQHYGFDDWIGTRYERSGAGYSGEKTVASHDKESALKSLVGKHNVSWDDSYAVGDSASDAPMLRLVTHPIAFNPDQSLYDIATEVGWDIVIERKNVIYKLHRPKDESHYQLLA